MRRICFAAAFTVLVAACTATSPPANRAAEGNDTTGNDSYMLHLPNGAPPGAGTTRPPRLTVGTSYPDTQLILPWFLNDLIDFVNYR